MKKPIAIEVEEARTHNLKGISCRIPHGALTVVTGPSGAGKSSLAFDTIYAEAQRRFVESMSTYARQFLEQMERPPLAAMHNILPAVALEARNAIKNARSTVGTITEVQDLLRLLFTHLGEVSCPRGHGSVARLTAEQAADALARGAAGESFVLIAAVPRPSDARRANAKLKELVRQGYFRRFEEGEVVRMVVSSRWLKTLDPLPLVLGRYRAGDEAASSRLVNALEEAYQLAGGTAQAVAQDGACFFFSRSLICRQCGLQLHRPVPALFSFNSPLGACPTCQGFGRVVGIDPERVVPDPSRTLTERPFAPWNTPTYGKHYAKLYRACRERGVDLDVPWQDLPQADRDFVWSGQGFTSLERFFAWLERRSYRVHARIFLARFRAYNPCPSCGGTRLKPAALGVRVKGQTLPELTSLSLEKLRAWLAAQRFRKRERSKAGHLLDQLGERLETLNRVGLDYLTLDRQARTLSGGEAQRIQLATALGSGLTSTLYVLDEPTIGLHPQDAGRLLELLHDLARRGNTVLVVEHDPALIRGADHVIDLGPRAGDHGGRLIAEGTVAEILAHPESLTGDYLRRPAATRRGESGEPRKVGDKRLKIIGAAENNLRRIDVEFPFPALVAVTGVSGSGKSTLIDNVLHGTYQRSRGVVDVEPGACDRLEGLDELADVILVDQRPLGRSSRSNPITYIKAYDEIRKLFAATPKARARGIQAGHFSFNTDRGRCPACQGTGELEIDMHFMAPVVVACDVCQGRQFKPEVLEIVCRGRDIHQTLALTVDDARMVFADRKRLCSRFQALVDVGLGYLRLGQPTSTLSGGEAQRLKLASFLDRPAKDNRYLFLFDEPTTGLHLADIDLLYQTLRRLVDDGHGVVVVEHHLDLIASADWIVDLGPGGGVHGGELLYSGPLAAFVDGVDSPTASELRGMFED